MKKQYMYLVHATNKHTGISTIKLGFTTDPKQRLSTLRKRNTHWQYGEMSLFTHSTTKYVKGDEQRLHEYNRYYQLQNGGLNEAPTEHYESCHMPVLYNQLMKLGYKSTEEQPIQNSMFEWV
ncbi:hypothetical protein IGU62_002095 [Escherichia coli]|uniref:GIY-YIG nuclease family protein n=1 Tax=Escherichia coli TaxID=562 RepID=UPI000DA4A96C|nr:GIY-YIG nuclease family protein [Escherichia coli]EFL9656603.1 hypothetical protein [Escherichia coli]EGL8705589.1 hypothetical protein [Escherichia coli]EIP3499166.1 GIY-YIG nuclease family protein [Escherichia coli]EKH9549081.1 GIY-YIG nuclease family protein [Escherichia coli]EMB0435173.1 GIY-YIG nuclease family protein [Escherichia coli]